MKKTLLPITALALASLLTAPAIGDGPEQSVTDDRAIEWAIAIHGGAGAISKDAPEEDAAAYRSSLAHALGIGKEILDEGGTALDAVEEVIRFLESDSRFNAGKGAVFTHEGEHELDASIMDGSDLSCGAVTGVTTVEHPITLARLVMTESKHVFFGGLGAEAFADSLPEDLAVARVENSFFDTERRRRQLEESLPKEERTEEQPEKEETRPEARDDDGEDSSGGRSLGTVGAVALDRHGDLAAGTSTGGLTDKRYGRIGDSPVIGAGTYADNRTCAVSGTGQGEEFIRHAVAHDISARMMHGGTSVTEAAETVIREVLEPGEGGVIALSHDGEIAMPFNTGGMYRGAADSSGRFEVGIWEEMSTVESEPSP